MQIQPLLPHQSSVEVLFDSYIIENLTSFNELIETYKSYKQNNTGKTIILTLDDLGQAEYTSTHSILSNDLDETEGYDLSRLDKSCFEDGEHLGYLTTPSEFFIRKENFLKQAKDIDFLSICNSLTIDENEISILEKINQSPFSFLDKQILLKIVPVEKTYHGICGFPNGYFQSDLNPFENYALAKHLFEKYNFELFGIGASFLGFIRNEKLEENKVTELIADLSKLYNIKETAFDNFFKIIKNNNYLFLKYIEYLEG
jgi:hypothetical protein